MTREEIMHALSVAIEFIEARGAPTSYVLGALLQHAAILGINNVMDGTDVEGFLVLCRAAFESELKKHEALKGGS